MKFDQIERTRAGHGFAHSNKKENTGLQNSKLSIKIWGKYK